MYSTPSRKTPKKKKARTPTITPRRSRYLERENAKQHKELIQLRKIAKRLRRRTRELANKIDSMPPPPSRMLRRRSSVSDPTFQYIRVKKEDMPIDSLPSVLEQIEAHAMIHRINDTHKRVWYFDDKLRTEDTQLTFVAKPGNPAPPTDFWNTIVSDNGLRKHTSSQCIVTSSVAFEEGEGLFPFSLQGNLFARLRFVPEDKIMKMLNYSTTTGKSTSPIRRGGADSLFVTIRDMAFFAGPKGSSPHYYILDTDKGEVLEHEGNGELNVVQSDVEFPCRLMITYKSLGGGMLTVDSTVGLPVVDMTADAYDDDDDDEEEIGESGEEIMDSYEL